MGIIVLIFGLGVVVIAILAIVVDSRDHKKDTHNG